MAIDISWLEKNILKREVTAAERSALDCITVSNFSAGEKIITEGQAGGTLEIMRSGKAKVEDNNRYEGRVILAEIESGTIFGELSFLNSKRKSADVTALEDCVVYDLKQEDFTELMKNHHELAYTILTAIMDRQTSIIMSQRVTLAPLLRNLKEKAKKLPLFIKVAPVVFIILYILAFFYISYKDFDYSN
ncbi:cAMP-binding domain of CRP or a regulatory subunit of cAMP-dependent protein kinases [Mariprofundus ferrinatatus]|uniref:cAMP-binding domain of CRP or a regulatory subunit of cAMP-dependent protein kinases n=1 Tax=Mariprofundus ferrinatatus TaxID=1921087 RepID=A0A2K8LDQ7_9PROT|nr:cyclic nucleotide-binding domain-containing protein [Mariprofundus ferrinatatus]ATX82416.1 cAMP-binding domain of CRP or a regulatory subunit of cAMP-dependent protein kinases [Mariprofundus ferrinatatus]